MAPIPFRRFLNALLVLTAMAVVVLPGISSARSSDVAQRQARIDGAITRIDQVIRQLRARAGDRRSTRTAVPPSPCLESETAWRGCLQDFKRATALLSDASRARRADDHLDHLIALAGALLKGDTEKDIDRLVEIMAYLKEEKQQLIEASKQEDRPDRSPPTTPRSASARNKQD